MHSIIVKIDHMISFWFFAVLEGKKSKLKDSIALVHHTLEFMGYRSESTGTSDTRGEASVQDTG